MGTPYKVAINLFDEVCRQFFALFFVDPFLSVGQNANTLECRLDRNRKENIFRWVALCSMLKNAWASKETQKQKSCRKVARKFHDPLYFASNNDKDHPLLRFFGSIFASVRKSEGSGSLKLKLRGMKLTNVEGFFGTSDPFFEISKKVEAGGSQTW